MTKYDEIINSCTGLIYMIIRKYFRGCEIEDLYQEGVKGVIKAYQNYQNNRMTKFSTYAYKYIYGEIYAYVSQNKPLKLSKDYISLYRSINEARSLLSQKLMKEPSNIELASYLEVDVNIINSVLEAMNGVDSLDRPIYNDGKEVTYYDTIGNNKDYYNIDKIELAEVVRNLPEPDKSIIYLRYYKDKTQSEVADILGMSQVGVSRTEKKTLRRIRENYQNVA